MSFDGCFLIGTVAAVTILVAWLARSRSKLSKMLVGWCNPENYERAVEAERNRLDEVYAVYLLNWQRTELEEIRRKERAAADSRAFEELTRWREAEIEAIRA